MYIKTQKVGDRTMVHERSYYDLTLATSDEDGSYLIALVQVDDNFGRDYSTSPSVITAGKG